MFFPLSWIISDRWLPQTFSVNSSGAIFSNLLPEQKNTHTLTVCVFQCQARPKVESACRTFWQPMGRSIGCDGLWLVIRWSAFLHRRDMREQFVEGHLKSEKLCLVKSSVFDCVFWCSAAAAQIHSSIVTLKLNWVCFVWENYPPANFPWRTTGCFPSEEPQQRYKRVQGLETLLSR